jgi:hypothetical protein
MSKYPYHRGSHYIYDLLLPFKVPLLAKLLGLTTIGLIVWILLTGERRRYDDLRECLYNPAKPTGAAGG